jgi:4a-hydroxytetrahydrobiopterin dehydratase
MFVEPGMELDAKSCEPCRGGVAPLNRAQAELLLPQVSKWRLADDDRSIFRRIAFKNFREALAFVNQVGELAEAEGHHPDIEFGWGYVNLTLRTHKINGLHENDFILAAKIDHLTP